MRLTCEMLSHFAAQKGSKLEKHQNAFHETLHHWWISNENTKTVFFPANSSSNAWLYTVLLFAPHSHYVHQQQLCMIWKLMVRLKGAIRFNSQNRAQTSDKKAAKNYEAHTHSHSTRLVQRALCVRTAMTNWPLRRMLFLHTWMALAEYSTTQRGPTYAHMTLFVYAKVARW